MPLQDVEHQAQGRPEWRKVTRRRAKGHIKLSMPLSQSKVMVKDHNYFHIILLYIIGCMNKCKCNVNVNVNVM